ncbi:PHD finger protein 19 [Neocloeon triangulifer]|uniref:PHD finger protein 19 n=1 Tax=Neocloeon triangulifer TaxID=2078957 RepID=UPI00286F2BB8|nr:PHD finger protein 19 [Neocloeon triangulifer]
MENHSAFPDSTTKEKVTFVEGEDVFVSQKDGRLYFGTIVQVEYENKRCLINFGDDTKQWSFFHTIRRLSSNVVSDGPCCVVCKTSAPKNCQSNEVVTCVKCDRGYHQKCHVPRIENPLKKFTCQRCSEEEEKRLQKELREQKKIQQQKIGLLEKKARKSFSKPAKEACLKEPAALYRKLAYDATSLTWDSAHRTNHEQKYCYCGETGQWFFKMLQCLRCKQWFHEKCVRSLSHPLFYGDRFFVFVCENCNEGYEYVRRMEIGWIDLVHLSMYNLTLVSIKKYHDIETVITSFILENWDNFNLPDKIHSASVTERKEKIFRILQSEKQRFKWGKEVKKKTTLYALRLKVPPSAPPFNVPLTGRIDDAALRHASESNRRVKFVFPSNSNAKYNSQIGGVQFPDGITYLGKNSGESVTSKSDATDGKLSVSSEASVDDSESSEVEEESEGGSVKCRPAKGTQFDGEFQKRRASLRATPDKKETVGRKRMRSEGGLKEGEKEIKNKTARKLIKNAINKSQKLLKTSPSRADRKELPSKTQLSKAASTNSTPVKEETKAALQAGKDFLKQLSQSQQQQTAKKTAAPPLPVAIRPTKRQLSEKDIRIGKNGEIKRRRFRRRNTLPGTNIPASSLHDLYKKDPSVQGNCRTTYHRSVKVASINPRLSGTLVARSGRDLMQFALNAARLKLKPTEEEEDEEEVVVEAPSTSAAAKDLTPAELRMAIGHYFSPANRIINGESFNINGKRTRLDGTVEYLIEWDRPVNF